MERDPRALDVQDRWRMKQGRVDVPGSILAIQALRRNQASPTDRPCVGERFTIMNRVEAFVCERKLTNYKAVSLLPAGGSSRRCMTRWRLGDLLGNRLAFSWAKTEAIRDRRTGKLLVSTSSSEVLPHLRVKLELAGASTLPIGLGSDARGTH